MDAPSKAARGSLDVSKRAAKATTQCGDVVGTTVGETPFGVGPDRFVGVELRGIGRKVFEMQPGEPMADFSNPSQYILGPFGPDTDLRRFGLRLAEHGGKSAKKRAAVAVARKLAVLLHRLWTTGEAYEAIGYSERHRRAA